MGNPILSYTTRLLDDKKDWLPKIDHYCSKCLNIIEKKDLDVAFKFTFGESVDNVFFPGKKTHFYHQDCITTKKKEFYCHECKKVIKSDVLDSVFIFVFGRFISNIFIPVGKKYHFHAECLNHSS